MSEIIKCLSCNEKVRTWKAENLEYPTYTDDQGIERHSTDNVLMCLNKNCIEHGVVHKYIKGVQVEYNIKLEVNMKKCSEIDCTKNLDKVCTVDECVLIPKLKRVKSETEPPCEKCIGYESEEKCLSIMMKATCQGLMPCFHYGKHYIFLEDGK